MAYIEVSLDVEDVLDEATEKQLIEALRKKALRDGEQLDWVTAKDAFETIMEVADLLRQQNLYGTSAKLELIARQYFEGKRLNFVRYKAA